MLSFLAGTTWKPSCGEQGIPSSHRSSVETSWDAVTELLSLRREGPQAGPGAPAGLHLPCLSRISSVARGTCASLWACNRRGSLGRTGFFLWLRAYRVPSPAVLRLRVGKPGTERSGNISRSHSWQGQSWGLTQTRRPGHTLSPFPGAIMVPLVSVPQRGLGMGAGSLPA